MAKLVVEAPATGLRLLTTRAQIKSASDLAREAVPTPEWGEDTGVLVQALDVNRRLAWLQFISVRETNTQTGRKDSVFDPFKPSDAALAVLGIIDEEGEPVYSLADIEELGTKHPRVIGRIAGVVSRLSAISDTEVLGENLKATNGASPSDSPDT